MGSKTLLALAMTCALVAGATPLGAFAAPRPAPMKIDAGKKVAAKTHSKHARHHKSSSRAAKKLVRHKHRDAAPKTAPKTSRKTAGKTIRTKMAARNHAPRRVLSAAKPRIPLAA